MCTEYDMEQINSIQSVKNGRMRHEVAHFIHSIKTLERELRKVKQEKALSKKSMNDSTFDPEYKSSTRKMAQQRLIRSAWIVEAEALLQGCGGEPLEKKRCLNNSWPGMKHQAMSCSSPSPRAPPRYKNARVFDPNPISGPNRKPVCLVCGFNVCMCCF